MGWTGAAGCILVMVVGLAGLVGAAPLKCGSATAKRGTGAKRGPAVRVGRSDAGRVGAPSAPHSEALARAGAAARALQTWYKPSTGLWATTGWWNSANALGALIDYSALAHSREYFATIANTYEKNRRKRFLNKFYDDEGWWALTWVKAYDLTRDRRYLDTAKAIFSDMKGGWDDHCSGGIWWNKDRKYKNAIANELFLSVAEELHLRTPGDKGPGSYQVWANREWEWFFASSMINSQNLINDGLRSNCTNNGGETWTYNQGVVLQGLVGMFESTGNRYFLREASAIADAAIHKLVTPTGILEEPCELGRCGGDGPQFKGIFMRGLARLYRTTHNPIYGEFIDHNAESIWHVDRTPDNKLGLHWAGPFDTADASRQSSAMDALNAAARVHLAG